MKKILVFDMDGTIADLYGVENWLEYLNNEDVTPYEVAEPLYQMAELNEICENLKQIGFEIIITSWLSKMASKQYENEIAKAKTEWVKRYNFPVDRMYCVPYGTPKEEVTRELGGFQILIDDEQRNLDRWTNGATFNAQENIIEFLRSLGL